MAWTATGRWVNDEPLGLEDYDRSNAQLTFGGPITTGLLSGAGGYTPALEQTGIPQVASMPIGSTAYNPPNIDGGFVSVPTGYQTNPDAGAPIPVADPPLTPTSPPVPVPVPSASPTPVSAPVLTATPTPVPTQTQVPVPVVTPAAPPSAIPVPTAAPLPPPIAMPDLPVARDASVANQLTGLLASDSPYIALARNAGMRTAGRRGLLNSSIAAGSAEAAAIAAAAPIASQDASQIQQTNQSNLESALQLRNASTLQNAQFAMDAWKTMDSNIQQILLNNSSNAAGMERLLKQGEIESALALMREDRAMTQTQINANVSLLSGYMSAFAALANNENLPATARDAYIAEFQKVTSSGQRLVNVLSGMPSTAPATGIGSVGSNIPTGTSAAISYQSALSSWATGAVNAMMPEITKQSNIDAITKITDPVERLKFVLSISPSSSSQYPLYEAYIKSNPKPVPPVPPVVPSA